VAAHSGDENPLPLPLWLQDEDDTASIAGGQRSHQYTPLSQDIKLHHGAQACTRGPPHRLQEKYSYPTLGELRESKRK